MNRSLAVALVVLVGASARAQPAAPLAGADAVRVEAFIGELIGRMTLEEKLGQLTQYSGAWAVTGPAVPQGGEAEVRAGRVGSYLNVYGAEATCAAQRIAVEESRLGIPLIFAHDVIHGFRTVFPTPLAEAAAWDPALAERTARVAAREAASAGLHWTFAPMVDLARDPRWGRVMEGSGEDPFLGSVLAAARVRGFQGGNVATDSTLVACAKHYAAYGGAEAGRDYNTVDISERTLREMYLLPFEAAVRAGAQTLMAGFNEVGGVPVTASRFLMSDVLRGEWGFDGLVVSDYTGVWELLWHGVAADSAHAARLALAAGVDVEMISGMYVAHLPDEIAAGRLPMDVVDEAVRRVLRVKARAGLFDDPYRNCRAPGREAATLLAPAHRRLAREAAQRSVVLLKNDGGPNGSGPVLPLSRDVRSLAVIGSLATDSASVLGAWAGASRVEEAVPLLTGLRAALPGVRVTYAPGYVRAEGGFEQVVPMALSQDTTLFAEAVRVAREADAVVLVLGEHRELSGEAASRTDIGLPGVQLALARRILAAGRPARKPLAGGVMNGRPHAHPQQAAEAPAILVAWHLGSEMGHAVADVLLGDANPGGKLPMTFPRSAGQIPLYYNHKNTGRPQRDPAGTEKYVSRFMDSPNAPLFPFGHGLSYTTFAFANLRLSAERLAAGDSLTVSVDVTNTGRRAGDEVAQLYVRDEVRSVTPPVRELKGFERITLGPGETRTVSFSLSTDALRFWGPDEAWTVEPGWFTVYVGPSSVGGREARFEVVP